MGLDRINLQIAARLLGAFKDCKMMEPARRKFAKAPLLQVAKADGLSPDVLEIAQRSLE